MPLEPLNLTPTNGRSSLSGYGPAALARAVKEFVQSHLIFYEEEKSKRQAEAAEKWADVRRKELENLEKALSLRKQLGE